MVRKQFKYHWKNRKQVFELKNKRLRIIAEIENVGLIGMRARDMADHYLMMTGLTPHLRMAFTHPLSETGDSAPAPNSDAL